jgi:uncharacterized protein YfiM (DUF2279 family)
MLICKDFSAFPVVFCSNEYNNTFMPTRDEISEIIASFMNTASPQEIQELKALLQSRKSSVGLGKIDLTGMAKQISASIRQQMGLSQKALRKTAVEAVSRLIRIHAPDISDQHLSVLLNEMIPSFVPHQKTPLPPDLLTAMVHQFVDYSLGRMEPEDKARMPEQWAAKYWYVFPPVIRGLISKLLYSEIDEELFGLTVREALRRMEAGEETQLPP